MTNNISTSVPQIYATPKAFDLAERFFSCPTAVKILESERFLKPIYIDCQNILGPKTLLKMDDHEQAIEAKIFIPEKALQTDDALHGLVFEIFNAQKPSDVYQQAKAGSVGMDSYAYQIGKREIANTQGRFALIKECGNQWSISHQAIAEEYARDENLHPRVALFIQEASCHTDFYRKEWINSYQQIYCEKHPEEKRSCETTVKDLCSVEQVMNMTENDRNEFQYERICQLFSGAHEKVKNDPYIRDIVLKKCPQVLRKPSHRSARKEL